MHYGPIARESHDHPKMLCSLPLALFSLLAILMATACSSPPVDQESEVEPPPAVDYEARAQELAREMIVIDTHVDLPYFPFKTLSWITAKHHRHHENMQMGNYATITLIYDKMFGTFE